ncbi:MAG: hydrogenase expression/formation protein HypE [Rubripirellula sp.]|nr:hydrogenase expression/formation protein HypE [Rubripirellula sp.]
MHDPSTPACRIEMGLADTIQLAHGEGGRLMRQLIENRIAPLLSLDRSGLQSDAAVLGQLDGETVVTTDSFVVSPLFFPGGDIGSLAVHGTINDLAMAGATPTHLTLALILEEGFALQTLDRILNSIADAANHCGVSVVAGDTKVVPRGAADGIFINTTGIGVLQGDSRMRPDRIEASDQLIVSGPIGKHGLAVLSAREKFGFKPAPESDSAPLHQPAQDLRNQLDLDLHAMRDATRGGVAAVLHEWAEASGQTMWIDAAKVPVTANTHAIAELLGIDPLFVANEGTFLVAVHPDRCEAALDCLRSHSVSAQCCVIGHAQPRDVSAVLIRRGIGVDQPLDEPSGAMLPRIC